MPMPVEVHEHEVVACRLQVLKLACWVFGSIVPFFTLPSLEPFWQNSNSCWQQ